MTNLAMNNVLACKEHPALKSFIDKGILNFARFDAAQDTDLNLIVSDATIVKDNLNNLYSLWRTTFNSIPQELLYVGEDQIYEADSYILRYKIEKQSIHNFAKI